MFRAFAVLSLLLLCAAPVAAQQVSPCNQTINISAVAAATLLAAPASTSRVYVCFLAIGAAAASTVTITEGTGATCGTGTTTLATFGYPAAVTPPVAMGGSGVAIIVTQIRGDSLCITPSASNVSGTITIGFGP